MVEEVKGAINWDYKSTQIEAFNVMLRDWHRVCLAKQGIKDISVELRKLVASMSAYYTVVMGMFDQQCRKDNQHQYIERFRAIEEMKINPGNGEQVYRTVKDLYYYIVSWSQTDGPFAMLNYQRGPSEQWI